MNIQIDRMNSDKVMNLMVNRLANSGNNNQRSGVVLDRNINELKIEKPEVDLENVKDSLKKISEASEFLDKKVELRVNEDINRVIITVLEKGSNRVIREIPCEELQNLAAHLKEAIGILFDKKA